MAYPRDGEDGLKAASSRVEADLRLTLEANQRVTLLRWFHRATLACALPALALFVYGGARLDHPGVLIALASLLVFAWGAFSRTKRERPLALSLFLGVWAASVGTMSFGGFVPGPSSALLVLILVAGTLFGCVAAGLVSAGVLLTYVVLGLAFSLGALRAAPASGLDPARALNWLRAGILEAGLGFVIALANASSRKRLEQLLEERQRAESKMRFVAEASNVLAESLDYEATLGQVARLVVSRLADWCLIDVVEGDRLRRVACAHVDPLKDSLVKELRGRVPILLGSGHPAARALAMGVPYIIADATDEFILAHSPDALHAGIVRELGTRSVMSVPLIAHGHALGVITFNSARPFTYGPRATPLTEEIARRAATAIENACLYKKAQDSIRARDEFLALASHELRTPVTSLLLTAQGLRSGRLSPERNRSAVDLFERELGRLDKQIADMLRVGEILVGRAEIHAAPTDLAALVRDEVARSALVFARARCPVTLHIDEPVRGFWDPDKLAQVVANLVANAVKFGAGKPVEIRVDERASVARLVVVDHGIGIDAQALPHVFEKFERAVSSRSYGGLGLGLYLVRNIVGAHGGTVRVESTPNVETSFTIQLPVTGPTRPAAAAA